MDDLGLHQGKGDQHDPEENQHPAAEVALPRVAARPLEHLLDGEDGRGEAAEQQDHDVVADEPGVDGLLTGEELHVPPHHLEHEVGSVADEIDGHPGQDRGRRRGDDDQQVARGDREAEPP